MTLIVTPKNRKEEKVLKAFLQSLEIGFHSETDEDKAMANAVEKGEKQRCLIQKRKRSL